MSVLRIAYLTLCVVLALPEIGLGQLPKQEITSGRHSAGRHSSVSAFVKGFEQPPAQARPFVRWWWNGNHIAADELKLELNLLKAAGFGGIEINPIAMPETADPVGTKPVAWLSKDWNNLLAMTAQEAKKRGMLTDLIVGSGWPFGGEFLAQSETVQRVISNTIPCEGGTRLTETVITLLQKAKKAQSRSEEEATATNELLFITLLPKGQSDTTHSIDLLPLVKQKQQIDYVLPTGSWELHYGILQRGHREVMHGALGAAGPVMDHYRQDVTLAYLNRLKKIEQDTGIPLKELIRALFCDSIELAGANWTDGFDELFYKTYGYKLEPYFPFVFYDSFEGYAVDKQHPVSDEIRRVRYDYNKLLVSTFLNQFTRTFQQYCTDSGLLCRYQAYGTPFFMGLAEGNMIPDIPESNNWIYSANTEADAWSWNQQHGYMIWNLYAAAGGHLMNRSIISVEAMTNTRGVFKASLEDIKRNDDMNFITGMNHSILHGYNYSPKAAGFPGWVRYGEYFSEQNPWWPYLSKWCDYNARLSYVFQQSRPVKKIAILAPTADNWTTYGLVRKPLHVQPWYCYRLWEPISQAGSSCEYVSEQVIADAQKQAGTLRFGPMQYQTLVLCDVVSIDPKTALAILAFVKAGGRLVIIGQEPSRSVSLQQAPQNDKQVQDIFSQLKTEYPKQVVVTAAPASETDLLSWTTKILAPYAENKDVVLDTPNKNVFQIHQVRDNQDIYFFTNTNRAESVVLKATFSTGQKIPQVWNPETGQRTAFPYEKNPNELTLELSSAQSLLLVFEPAPPKSAVKATVAAKPTVPAGQLSGTWRADYQHINGKRFSRTMPQLTEFGLSNDTELNSFAGIVTYTTSFTANGNERWLTLGTVNKGVTEVYLNGQQIGTNWYGQPLFPLGTALKKGPNQLQIRYTTVLSNYARSLTNNPTASQWTKGYKAIPMGLAGNVTLYR